jgi:hypothetical protein
MKLKPKLQHWMPISVGGLALATLLIGGAGASFAQTADLTIATFDTATGTGTDNTAGTGIGWGPSTWAWDAVEGNPSGAVLITARIQPGQDTPLRPRFCINGGNPWYNAGTADFSLYKDIQFDIKWDNTSDITIAQFNNVTTIPITQTNSLGQLILNQPLNQGVPGFDVLICGPTPIGNQGSPFIINTNMPAAAASGWVHMTIPINPSLAGLAGQSGITFNKWINNYSGQCANTAEARFWIDNIVLGGTAGPPPPPTIKVPTKATPGLNVFASTGGIYDRQSAVLRQTAGLSWVGVATPANPVTYSFTIAGYPDSNDCEAWLFLVPNPSALDGAPDWNQTNCVKVRLQGNANSATMHFQYKINENNQQAMYGGGSETRVNASTTNNYYYTAAPGSLPGGPIIEVVSPGVNNITNESGYLGAVTNNGVLGTWRIKFTSDSDVTLIAPNGNSTNFTFPAYNVPYFSEQAAPGMYVYLGMQANNVNAFNQAVVYSDFAISNTAAPFSENFLTNTVLDTTTVWNTGAAAGPQGVRIVPAGSPSWVSWTLPDTGFGLEVSPSLSDPLAWISLTNGPIVPMNGIRSQLVGTNEIPAGSAAFFRLTKRVFTKLQILLPGESPAPNTPTGKTGTPTPQNVGVPFEVIVNAVDASWHKMDGITDQVILSSSTDPSFTWPTSFAVNMVNGTATFDTANLPVAFGTAGSQTVTATDGTDPTKTADTSSAVTVSP